MDASQDLYAILGTQADASQDDIRAAYRTLARRLHPDANPNPGAAIQFREIAEAHETLGNPENRRKYDNLRKRLAAEPNYFVTEVTSSKRVLPILGEPQVVYVLLQLTTHKDFQGQQKRVAPLNLALVLDRSTSMKEGGRLDRVKVAAHQIIDQLGPSDFLSLVSFSDRAEALIKAEHVTEPTALKALVNLMTPGGGTEIFQGLEQGFELVEKNLKPDYVNHIILLTDGQTFDSELLSLDLADRAAKIGIGISAMGIGDEWNDAFLDSLASKTGGTCAYINSPGAVVKFLNERVRSLGASFAERITVSIAPDPDVSVESAFKLIPAPQPIPSDEQPLHLGALEASRSITLLLQLQMSKDLKEGSRSLIRLCVTGDILYPKRPGYQVVVDLPIQAAQHPEPEEPPRALLDALGKLTLYRLQQKAEEAIKVGNYAEATRQLENFATRALAVGHEDLARTAMLEANRVQTTKMLSEEGRKTMKFSTRMLLLPEGEG